VGEPRLRALLNRLRWDAGADAAGVALEYAARGESGESLETAPFTAAVEIVAAGVVLSGETFIPYHRIRAVRRGGETLWRAREKRGGDEG